jgi:ketosteroid isomerase-like protein
MWPTRDTAHALSQEHVEIVRGLFAALDGEDWETALGVFDPEVAGSAMEIDQRFFQVYAVGDGKITRMVEFARRTKALEAAGLSE